MDLINFTAETLRQKYNGKMIAIKPNEAITVDEATGQFMMSKLEARGLESITFRDDQNVLRQAALRHRLGFLLTMVKRHDMANIEQEKNKFNPLPMTAGVRKAKLLIPLYKKHLRALDIKLGTQKEKEIVSSAEAALASVSAADKSLAGGSVEHNQEQTTGMERDQLMARAEELGLQPEARWNAVTIKAKIREHMKANETGPTEPI